MGTEHLLLGLIHEADKVSGRVLGDLNVSLRDVLTGVEQIIGYRDERPRAGEISFTTSAKRALRLGLQESVLLGDRYIGSGHILFGLIREGEGVAAEVLTNLGAEAGRVYAHLCQFYGRGAPSQVRAS